MLELPPAAVAALASTGQLALAPGWLLRATCLLASHGSIKYAAAPRRLPLLLLAVLAGSLALLEYLRVLAAHAAPSLQAPAAPVAAVAPEGGSSITLLRLLLGWMVGRLRHWLAGIGHRVGGATVSGLDCEL